MYRTLHDIMNANAKTEQRWFSPNNMAVFDRQLHFETPECQTVFPKHYKTHEPPCSLFIISERYPTLQSARILHHTPEAPHRFSIYQCGGDGLIHLVGERQAYATLDAAIQICRGMTP